MSRVLTRDEACAVVAPPAGEHRAPVCVHGLLNAAVPRNDVELACGGDAGVVVIRGIGVSWVMRSIRYCEEVQKIQ